MHSSESNNEHAVVNLVWNRPREDPAICITPAMHITGVACNVLPSLKMPAQNCMWSTCLFTTITSPEKLERPQSWWWDAAVEPRSAMWSVRKMSSCPATFVRAEEAVLTALQAQTHTSRLPMQVATVMVCRKSFILPTHLRVKWPQEQQEGRSCLGTRREEEGKSEVGPRRARQLYQQQPTLSCTPAPHQGSNQACGGQAQEPWQMTTLGQVAGGGYGPQVSASESWHHLQSSCAATPARVSTCWLPTEEALSPTDFFFSKAVFLLLLDCCLWTVK